MGECKMLVVTITILRSNQNLLFQACAWLLVIPVCMLHLLGGEKVK